MCLLGGMCVGGGKERRSGVARRISAANKPVDGTLDRVVKHRERVCDGLRRITHAL